MNSASKKKYTALAIGGIIICSLVFILHRIGTFTHVSTPYLIFINILLFIFLWLVLSFLIHEFSIYKVLGLLGVLMAAIFSGRYLEVFNPITIPLLILFWLGAAYLIIPQFFKKYKIAILTVYGGVLSYFFIVRMVPNYLENNIQTFLNFMVMPIPFFAALWGYEQWRWLKTLQADKGKAELALLKSQINPHFFFNTLNNLYGLVVEKSEQAPEVVLKLSDMMRYTIYKGKEDFVPLVDEVAYLENYIELHKIRYQKKVDIRFTKQITAAYAIAPLLFIILLENAFKHGVERMTEGAFVGLNLTTQDNQISFVIENNFEEATTKKSIGIGLENLRKRLEHIYPNKHQLLIHKQASIYKAQLTINLK